MIESPVRAVDLQTVDESSFVKRYADCVVLTQDGRLLLQHRPEGWGQSSGFLTAFGGHIEAGETVMQALIRELHEELGAAVKEEEVISLGALTEDFTNHTELVYLHFWHDRDGTVTGCYEAEPRYYTSVLDALEHPKVMDYLKYMLAECQNRGLIS